MTRVRKQTYTIVVPPYGAPNNHREGNPSHLACCSLLRPFPFFARHKNSTKHHTCRIVSRTTTMMKAASVLMLCTSNALVFTASSSASFSPSSPLSMTSSLSEESDKSENSSVDPPRPTQQPRVVMSKAIPFLQCPAPLVDCQFAGNVGFDPLGLAKNREQLWEYREAEIKHARLAMLVCLRCCCCVVSCSLSVTHVQ